MIKIFSNFSSAEWTIPQNHFPDGTLRTDTPILNYIKDIIILWKYENDAELFTLICLAKKYKDIDKKLLMPYIPHARMDRVKQSSDVFTLKYFAETINSLGFKTVIVIDPHSSVSEALIDNIVILQPKQYIRETIRIIEKETLDLVLYFPDSGAAKRYTDLCPEYKYVYGNKKRRWEDGKILGIEILNDFDIDLKGKTILMIDDIISYGGSMKYSADKLKEMGVGKIYAYATHTENSILDEEKGTLLKSLNDGIVERLFTTNSIFTKEHEKITVMEVEV